MGSGYLTYHGVKKDYSVFKARVDGSLTEVTAEMLDVITSIGNSAFQYCTSLASITIPSSVTSIGYHAFDDCDSLTSVTIPSSVTSIGIQAFSGCDSLASVTIKDGATGIRDYAFYWCEALQSVTVEAIIPPVIGTGVFSRNHPNSVIYVPSESVETYKTATNWSTYASRIQAIPST